MAYAIRLLGIRRPERAPLMFASPMWLRAYCPGAQDATRRDLALAFDLTCARMHLSVDLAERCLKKSTPLLSDGYLYELVEVMTRDVDGDGVPDEAEVVWPVERREDCPGCGRVMSLRERREQGVCDDCTQAEERR